MVRSLVFSVPVAAMVLGFASGAYSSPAPSGPRMGAPSNISRKAFEGYYDGHKVTYLNTDVSDKADAAAMHINYAPGLKRVPLASAPEIYLVQGRAASEQLAVFGSEPGEPNYSPIWKETMLTWKPNASPILITSDTQIDRLEKKGMLSERTTSIRLNCPIVSVSKRALEAARSHRRGVAGAVLSTGTEPNPADFVDRVDNPWFPLLPGTTWIYRGVKDGKPSRDVVTVAGNTKLIQGVRATAVSDRLYLRGRLEERTTDWYAQDKSGAVWYFGENTAELNTKGAVTSREGSWQAGRHGAKAGVFMPAHPIVGQSFRQEFLQGHAEDHFQVLSLSAAVRTPAASSQQALLTKEWTPLEPRVLDHKLYVRGIGTVKEETVTGGVERNVLVAVRRS
jgi:hypothetical protein